MQSDDAPEEVGFREAVENYFDDPAHVRSCDIHDFLEYVSNRGLACAAVGGIIGSGQGFSAGGMAINVGSAVAFRWGMGGLAFFGGAYGLRAIRGKDDCINYGTSGCISYGLFRMFKLGPKGAITGFLMGAVGGTAYSLCSEELYSGLREMWLMKRRYLLTDNFIRRPTQQRMSPFPPREPPETPPQTNGK